MPDNRDSFVWPYLDDAAMLDVLDAFSADDHRALNAADLRLQISESETSRFVLPYSREIPLAPLRERLVQLVTEIGRKACGRSTEQAQSMIFDTLVSPQNAALILTLRLAATQPGIGRKSAHDGDRLALVSSADADRAAKWIADITKRARDARVLVARHPRAKSHLTFIHAKDDLTLHSTLRGLSAHLKDKGDVRLFQPTELGELRLWSDTRRRPLAEAMSDRLGRILGAAHQSSDRHLAHDVAIFDDRHGPVLLYINDLGPAPAAADVFTGHNPAQDLQVQVYDIVPHPEAVAALQDRISQPGFPVGYRMHLHPLRRLGPSETDIEQVQARIEELQDIVDQIRAQDAPTLRLMRFSDAQLPAMIDGLRRLPPGMQKSEHLRYAAGHAAGRAEPSHFVLYDPGHISLDVPEAYWRGRADSGGGNRPLSYWLDPHILQADAERRGNFAVFTPYGTALTPSLADFGGTLSETLKLVLGRLFVDTAHIVENADAQPMFIFSNPTEAGFRLDVEVLDANSFAPLKLQIRMLNDYLKVRGPNLVDATDLQDLAENLYSGSLAEGLHSEARHQQARAEAAWDEALGRIEDDAQVLLRALRFEVGAVQSRFTAAETYLLHAATRMEAMEKMVGVAEDALSGSADIARLLDAKLGEMSDSRDEFVERVLGEFSAAEQALAAATSRMSELQSQIEAFLNPK